MGWRRTINAVIAAERRAQREAVRKHRAQLQYNVGSLGVAVKPSTGSMPIGRDGE